MKKNAAAFALFVFFLGFLPGLDAKEIDLHFPHFTGHSYDWKIFQGEKELTVISGEIDPDGRVTLVMPDAFKTYRGMTRWMLKTGGGLDMIYVGKGFSVECLSKYPGDETIQYTGSPENDFLKAQYRRQETILKKLGAVNHFLQVYPPTEGLHRIISKEQKSLRKQFEKVQEDRTKTSLYAARFGEIVDFTKGVADKVYENPDDHIEYFNNFVTHTLHFEDLYTSGHWDQVLHSWLMINIRSAKDDIAFNDRLNSVLNRINPDDVLAAFAEKAVLLLVQTGKDDLLTRIALILEQHPGAKDGLSDRVQNMLASYKILTSTRAPDIVLQVPVRTPTGFVNHDILLETDKLNADYTVLLFYQSDCPLCEDALIALSNGYKFLKDNNIRVIAISGDENEQAFGKKIPYHQWPDNYCDFTGMDGANFKNYAVLGIPTLYLLDSQGIVLEKTAMVDELLKTVESR